MLCPNFVYSLSEPFDAKCFVAFKRQFHRREHGLRVIRQVPGGLIHFLPGDVRGLDADVAGGEFGFLCELFEFFENRGAPGQPQRESRPDVFGVDREQPHLRADLAVVAALRLFEHVEVGLHLGLVLERGAVDPLELRVVFVALVVGAGDMGELEGPDISGAHDVRAGAEVGEFAVAVERDDFAIRDVCDDIELELRRFAARPEGGEFAAFGQRDRLVARYLDPLENMVRLDLALHLLLDPREILRGDPVRELDIVVKPVLDRRAGRKLGLGPDFQNRGGQHVRAGMSDAFEISHGIEQSTTG